MVVGGVIAYEFARCTDFPEMIISPKGGAAANDQSIAVNFSCLWPSGAFHTWRFLSGNDISWKWRFVLRFLVSFPFAWCARRVFLLAI